MRARSPRPDNPHERRSAVRAVGCPARWESGLFLRAVCLRFLPVDAGAAAAFPSTRGNTLPPPRGRIRSSIKAWDAPTLGLVWARGETYLRSTAEIRFDTCPCISSVKQTHIGKTGVQRAPSPLAVFFWYFSVTVDRKVHSKQFDKPKYEALYNHFFRRIPISRLGYAISVRGNICRRCYIFCKPLANLVGICYNSKKTIYVIRKEIPYEYLSHPQRAYLRFLRPQLF